MAIRITCFETAQNDFRGRALAWPPAKPDGKGRHHLHWRYRCMSTDAVSEMLGDLDESTVVCCGVLTNCEATNPSRKLMKMRAPERSFPIGRRSMCHVRIRV